MSNVLDDIIANVIKTNTITDIDLDFDSPILETSIEQNKLSIKDESEGSLKFAIIGLGQGGGRIAQSFYDLGYKKNIIINTSYQDLNALTNPSKLKIGTTDGTGKNMQISAQAFTDSSFEILKLMNDIFGNDIDNILICAGSGGGTGSGTIIPTINISKIYLKSLAIENVDNKIGVIVTIPTDNELNNPIVKQNSLKILTSLSELSNNNYISPLIIIDNNKIKNLYPKLTVSQFYPTINEIITKSFHTFNIISTLDTDLISFDKKDYKSIISAFGHMVMGSMTIRDYSLISKLVRDNIKDILLTDGFDLETSRFVGIVIIGGKQIFDSVPGLMSFIEDAFGTISLLTGKAIVYRGLYTNDSNSLKVFTLISGLKEPIKRYRKIINI